MTGSTLAGDFGLQRFRHKSGPIETRRPAWANHIDLAGVGCPLELAQIHRSRCGRRKQAVSRTETGQVIGPLLELVANDEPPLRSVRSGFAQRTETQTALRDQHRNGAATKS